jgi:predicted GNAT superfamily acetyltransferase
MIEIPTGMALVAVEYHGEAPCYECDLWSEVTGLCSTRGYLTCDKAVRNDRKYVIFKLIDILVEKK